MKKNHTPYGLYEKYIKYPLDVILAIFAIIVLSPIWGIVAMLVRIKLGSPVIFKQLRPGKKNEETGQERLFTLFKFRTMTNEKDRDGNLLSDSARLTKFGKILRSTSLDELPELVNIIKGEMSIVGPRPQLVRDMVFMSEKQRQRHDVRPGLTGLAQIRGRNNLLWEEKLSTDLEYVEKITFWGDVKIIFETVIKVFKREDIAQEGKDTSMDFGDWLLEGKKITREQYEILQEKAKNF